MSNRFPLSEDYIYGGCISYGGDRTSLRNLRAMAKDDWVVYAVDINPGCFAPPIRFFVETTSSNGREAISEAIEALEEYARNHPRSRAAREILEADPEIRELIDSDIREDAYVGYGQVKADQIKRKSDYRIRREEEDAKWKADFEARMAARA